MPCAFSVRLRSNLRIPNPNPYNYKCYSLVICTRRKGQSEGSHKHTYECVNASLRDTKQNRPPILHLSPDRQTPSIFCKHCYLINSKLLPLSRPTQVCPLCTVITDRANVTCSAHQLPWHCVVTAFTLLPN